MDIFYIVLIESWIWIGIFWWWPGPSLVASCVIGRIRLPKTFPVTQKTWHLPGGRARGFQGPKGVQVEDRGMASVSHTSLPWNFVFSVQATWVSSPYTRMSTNVTISDYFISFIIWTDTTRILPRSPTFVIWHINFINRNLKVCSLHCRNRLSKGWQAGSIKNGGLVVWISGIPLLSCYEPDKIKG